MLSRRASHLIFFFGVRGAAARDAPAVSDAAVPLGRAGAIRSGCARSVSRRGMGSAFDAPQRSSARGDADSGRGLENIRIFDPVGAPHHAGDRRRGRVSFVSARDPAVAQVARRAGLRGGGVPDRRAAFLHAVHDGAARHARHDADGSGAAAVFRRTLRRLRPRRHGAGPGEGNRHQHSHGFRRVAFVPRKAHTRGAVFSGARRGPGPVAGGAAPRDRPLARQRGVRPLQREPVA